MGLPDNRGNYLNVSKGQKFRCIRSVRREYYHVGTIIKSLGRGSFTNKINENIGMNLTFSDNLSGSDGWWEPYQETFNEKLEDYM